MDKRVRIPFVMFVWVVIGVVVAMNKGYDDIDNGSELATFLLAVVLWPIPAFDGRVGIAF